jgi:hypothetical protein
VQDTARRRPWELAPLSVGENGRARLWRSGGQSEDVEGLTAARVTTS